MKVLITGADGFIGRNLRAGLMARQDIEVACFERRHAASRLPECMQDADFVFHLAGVNRPQDPAEFMLGNRDLTQAVCAALCRIVETDGRRIPIVLTSSTQAGQDTAYGLSKRAAEEAVFAAARSHAIPAHVFRLPNVFGKWCRPQYNSAVATFCHNLARGLPVQVHDPAAPLTLVHVEDVVARFIALLSGTPPSAPEPAFGAVSPEYVTTVGEVADLIRGFATSRRVPMAEQVSTGFARALYATYVSYLPSPEELAGHAPECSRHGA